MLHADNGSWSCRSTGGVVLTNKEGTIVCSNTLDDRLKIAYAQNLPDIRAALFGIEAPARGMIGGAAFKGALQSAERAQHCGWEL